MPGCWAQPLPQPSGVWRPRLQASCDTVQLWKLGAGCWGGSPGKKRWRRPHWAPFPTSGLRSSSDRPLALVRALQVCLCRPLALLTQTLPWWLKFWYYLGPTHHYRVLWWSPGSWLTLTNIMDLVWLPYDSPPHWQAHCPACLAVTLSFQPAFFNQVIHFVLCDKWNGIASH